MNDPYLFYSREMQILCQEALAGVTYTTLFTVKELEFELLLLIASTLWHISCLASVNMARSIFNINVWMNEAKKNVFCSVLRDEFCV